MTRLWLSSLVAILALVFAGPAMAQMSISHGTGTAPALGTVIRGSSSTTFSVSTSGVVTKTSGDGIRVSSATVTSPTISISCGLSILVCTTRYMRVTVAVAGASGSATITKFRVGGLSGTTYRSGAAPAEASSVTFDLNPVGLSLGASFLLGMDVTVPTSGTTGGQTFSYTVTVTML